MEQNHFEDLYNLIENELKKIFEPSIYFSDSLHHQMSYQINTGGKRLRALLPASLFVFFKREPKDILPLSLCIELIHNATLVHDDLQDGDEYRRNQLTVWKKFGVEQSLNVGDGLFFLGLQQLENLKFSADLKQKISQQIYRSTLNVIRGQTLEFELKNKDKLNYNDYTKMVAGKTSGLFSMPLVCAAISLRFSDEELNVLQNISENLGVLFQIQDDWIDLFGNKGRSVQYSDLYEGKRSIFILKLIEKSNLEKQNKILSLLDLPRTKKTKEDIDFLMQEILANQIKEEVFSEMKNQYDAILNEVDLNLPRTKDFFSFWLRTIFGATLFN
jgi:geranylgeranyl pyrophosphate synthase